MGGKRATKRFPQLGKRWPGANSVTSIVVGDAKQRSMGSLAFSLSEVREVKEFRAGGSAALSVTRNGAGAVREAPTMELSGVRSNLEEEAYMRTEGSREDMEIIPNPDPELPSLKVSSNEAGLSSSEVASARIASCSLKRIDPTTRLRQDGEGDAEVLAEALVPCDQLEALEAPLEDIQSGEGGEVLISS